MKNFSEIISAIDPNMDYTTKEIAKIVGVSQSALIAHVRRGTFPSARKVMNRWYIKGREAREYFAG